MTLPTKRDMMNSARQGGRDQISGVILRLCKDRTHAYGYSHSAADIAQRPHRLFAHSDFFFFFFFTRTRERLRVSATAFGILYFLPPFSSCFLFTAPNLLDMLKANEPKAGSRLFRCVRITNAAPICWYRVRKKERGGS